MIHSITLLDFNCNISQIIWFTYMVLKVKSYDFSKVFCIAYITKARFVHVIGLTVT